MGTKAVIILLMLVAGALAYCMPHSAGSIVEEDCESYAEEGNYIDAGCCYKSLGVWDKCTLYLLKGARRSEILWDLNRGSYQAGSVAKEYYNVEYSERFEIGSDMGVCLYNHEDPALTEKISQYYNWIEFYGFQHTDAPPFDMDATISALEGQLFPLEPTPTPTPVPTATSAPTSAATSTPVPEQDNTGIIAIVAVLILAVLAYFLFMKKKPPQLYPESMEKPESEKKGFLYKAAEKAKEEHEAELGQKDKQAHQGKTKHKKKK